MFAAMKACVGSVTITIAFKHEFVFAASIQNKYVSQSNWPQQKKKPNAGKSQTDDWNKQINVR